VSARIRSLDADVFHQQDSAPLLLISNRRGARIIAPATGGGEEVAMEPGRGSLHLELWPLYS